MRSATDSWDQSSWLGFHLPENFAQNPGFEAQITRNMGAVLVRDPCGIVCLIATYAAVIYADYVVVRWIVLQTMHNR